MEDGEGVDTSFIHSQKFVLLDKDYVVRGYYNGLDTACSSDLAKDIGLLMLEKDKKKKINIFQPHNFNPNLILICYAAILQRTIKKHIG